MRKLVSIQRIIDVKPIPDADKIEMLQVLGWELVSGKGNFKPGDLAIYFEVDSFLPCIPQFEFLRKSCYKIMADGSEGYRIRTIRLRGQISQGLALPFTELENCSGFEEGADLTEFLGVKKWEPPIPACLEGTMKGGFPSFFPVSDETRCLSENTEIFTDKGIIAINKIVRDPTLYKVLSQNIETGELEYVNVIDVSVQRNNNDWFEIITESGNILNVTENHYIYLPKLNCYRKVSELKNGDILSIKFP